MPELWPKVPDIVQEEGIKTIPKKKKCKKGKWLSEEALQIAMKKREAKSKGEKERYTHLNAEFQRIARRDKKAFLSDQCQETEENNRMGKTRDYFKKIGDAKGMFHAMMGMIKDRNSNDLTEAEEIKKRWQEYTEELYIKSLNDPDNHDGVITHLESGILECEIKLALGRITMNKASGGEKISSLLAQMVKRLPTMRETQIQSLGREYLLEKEMATHSSILAWKIPWTEEPGRQQSMGSQRVGHD